MIAFTSIALAFTLYVRYKLYLLWYQVKGLLTEYDTLIGTHWW